MPNIARSEFSLEEKIGQLLMVQFHGESVNEEAETLLRVAKVGAFIYYKWANGLTSPEQVQRLSAGLQALAVSSSSKVPLLIAADQEGGIVTRLKEGFTLFPGNAALGAVNSPELTRDAYSAIGIEMASVGINMNLAPVVDINSNPKNPVIGIRAFGETPDRVTALGRAALEGLRRSGVVGTLKHFPGYGDVAVDPHEDLATVAKPFSELEQVELVPFAQLAHEADAIMTAHVMVPALDPTECATLSPRVLGYLRRQLGFKGVIVADSLVMEGVMRRCAAIEDVAIRALRAGCDLLILGGKLLSGPQNGLELKMEDVLRVHRSLVAAVREGKISEERVNEALGRVLALKRKVGIVPKLDLQPTRIARELADRAIIVVKPFDPKGVPCVIHPQSFGPFHAEALNTSFQGFEPTEEEIQRALAKAAGADWIAVFTCNAWRFPSQQQLVRRLVDLGKPVVVIAARDPLDATLFPQAAGIMVTHSPIPLSLELAWQRWISGKL
jgi:beta-N-acetylhexosaminidase